MNTRLHKIINERINVIELTSKAVRKKLSSYPEGRIKVCRQGKNVYYYFISSTNETRLLKKTDQRLTSDLLQKGYYEQVIKALNNELNVLTKADRKYPELVAEDIYNQLSDDRKRFVKPIVLSDEQYRDRWLAQKYDKKPIAEVYSYNRTLKGDIVRSKSEVIIADRLYLKNIPYKYECPLIVDGKIIHPDFTILRMSDRKIVYYEHCGRMDDPEYSRDMVLRSRDYSREGIFQGDRLFYTFETSNMPLDISILDRMIEQNFR